MYPEHSTTPLKQGRYLQRKGKLAEAETAYRQATQMNPSFYGGFQCLGEVLLIQRKLDEAKIAYQQAKKLNPKLLWPHQRLGEIFLQQNKLDEAIAYFQSAIKISSDFSWAYNGLGKCYSLRSEWENAIAAYQKAVGFNLDSQVFRENLHWAIAQNNCFRKSQNNPHQESFELSAYWKAYHNLEPLVGFDSEKLAAEIKSTNYRDVFLSQLLRINSDGLNRIANIFNQYGYQFIETQYTEFIKFVTKPNFSEEIVKMIVTSGMARIPSPFSQNDAILYSSILCNDVNFILFRDGLRCFYIGQYCAQVAVIFPTMQFAVAIYEEIAGPWFNIVVRNAYSILGYLVANFNELSSERFYPFKYSGLFVAQDRPYHYFYDYLYGVHILNTQGLINPTTNIYTLKGSNFMSVSQMYGLNRDDYASDYKSINQKLLKNREFIISSSVQYHKHHNKKILDDLDAILVNSALHLCNPSDNLILDNLIKTAEACFPLIWIGIAGEKRAWKELVEAVPQIINLIHQSFPKVGVVLDGRTFPLTPSKGNYNKKMTAVDKEIAKQVEEKLISEIKVFNLVGITAAEKLCFANIIDFFITHVATDSLFVSRICKKPGIVHEPRLRGGQRSMHIHHHIIEIPPQAIVDYPNPQQPDRWSCTSYSIPWEKMYEQVLKLWESCPVSKPLVLSGKLPPF
ncbi:tetratricopeptide repeat protein [Dapis sp. BLCC M126]|uniref:tetratricopeptide repeat protein n=1 Tax=Dapis sp. BLCC M126 TaxID=3400189 RepID=UPI003CEAB700